MDEVRNVLTGCGRDWVQRVTSRLAKYTDWLSIRWFVMLWGYWRNWWVVFVLNAIVAAVTSTSVGGVNYIKEINYTVSSFFSLHSQQLMKLHWFMKLHLSLSFYRHHQWDDCQKSPKWLPYYCYFFNSKALPTLTTLAKSHQNMPFDHAFSSWKTSRCFILLPNEI